MGERTNEKSKKINKGLLQCGLQDGFLQLARLEKIYVQKNGKFFFENASKISFFLLKKNNKTPSTLFKEVFFLGRTNLKLKILTGLSEDD